MTNEPYFFIGEYSKYFYCYMNGLVKLLLGNNMSRIYERKH